MSEVKDVQVREKLSSTEAKKRLVSIVVALQGCKATEVAFRAGKDFSCEENVITLLDELVRSGEIQEVEYILPNMDYRIKSFYLPKNTQIKLN